MRSSLIFIAVVLTCCLVALGQSLAVTESSPQGTLQHELQCKADQLVHAYLGAAQGRVVVTLRQGQGLRREERQHLAERGFVVASQRKLEKYRTYQQEVVSEKLELPRSTTHQVEHQWIESIQVAVVVPATAHPEPLSRLLEAGLALRPDRGDRVVVVHSL